MNNDSPWAGVLVASHLATTSRALALSCSFLVPAVAAAQTASSALEEIVVTAERRSTALQDTPISIVAMSTETLERKGIEDVSDVALFTPNLAINGSRGYGNNQPTFSIRGISGGGGTTSERGVALYIDGIYVPRTNGSVFKVFDIERIEVLRGPQGTLFGRNSTGGAIRLVTKQPGPDFESYVRATVGNFDRHDVSGMVNVPLSDSFSVRAQGAYLHQDGYVERGSQDLGGSEDKLGRLQMAFQATDNLKATFGVLYSDSTSDGSPQDLETFDMRPGTVQGNFADWLSDAYAAAGQPRLDAYNDPRLVKGDFSMPDICLLDDFNPDWDKACEQSNDNEYYQADANIEWTLNEKLKLTSVTGYSHLDHTGQTDWQLLGTERRPDDVQSKVFYQEFQLNAELFGGAVDWISGLSYFREDSSSASAVINRRGTSTFSPTGGAANGDGDAGLRTSANTATEQISNSYGWFNSATWHVTDKFNFTGGARLAYDKKEIEVTRYPSDGETPAWTPAPGTTSTTVNTDDDWQEVDWRATLDYHFNDDLMVYTTASKAYRAGAYSFTVLPNISGALQSGDFFKAIPPEKVVNYELGTRTQWLDGRLRVNPTVFYMLWSSRQAARQIVDLTTPTGFRIGLVDSGDVDVYGVEMDTQFVATDNLLFDGAVGITKYDLKDPVANGGPNLFPAQASPTFNVGATYSVPISESNLSFNLNYSYVGKQETHPTENSDSSYELPSYDLVNARVTWTTASKTNTFTLFANNLLDETYATYATRFGGGYFDSASGAGVASPLRSAIGAVRGRPRDYGLTFQHNF